MDFKIFDPSKNTLREIPESNGVFLVLLKYSGQLFYFYSTEHVPDFSNFTIGKCVMPVVYIGSTNNLRKRIWTQTLNGTADKMTMRKSIGVLMGLNFDPPSDRKRFCISDEKSLSDWMFENLIFLYCETEDPMAETKLITQYNPPLNIKNNTNPVNAEFRKELSSLRSNVDFMKSSNENDNFDNDELDNDELDNDELDNDELDNENDKRYNNVPHVVAPSVTAISSNDEIHTASEVKNDSLTSTKYSKTRIALGIVVILVIIYNIGRLFGDYTIHEDGQTQYIVTQDFLAATDYETVHNLNSLYLNNPNEPEITDSYAAAHWDKFVNFYQGDVVVVLKFDGYGYRVKRLSDGMKGIIPEKLLSKKG